jgi:hypothetical protein
MTLSNQVTNNNFKLAIYEEIYNKTLDDIVFRFTPEIRKQYEDSQLWRSFVQALASEVATGRFEIKEALKQLNIQKAVDVFLNIWTDVTGIVRLNTVDVSGLPTPETDLEYRQRLVDNVFWDKITNLALKKTTLLKLGYDGDVLDVGVNADIFRNVPNRETKIYTVTHDAVFIPGETIIWLRSGPNSSSVCVSDTGNSTTAGTLTYSNYQEPDSPPPIAYPVYSYFGQTSFMFSNHIGEPAIPGIGNPGTLTHDVVANPFPTDFTVGAALTFAPSGATGVFKSNIAGVLTFELTYGSVLPQPYDIVADSSSNRTVLTGSPIKQTSSSGNPVNSKLLSNIYSVNLGLSTLDDATLNDIYDQISALGAIGNVLTKILQDVSASFDDWDTILGNIPYGEIFMGIESYGGIEKDTDPGAGVLWSIDEQLYIDNQRTMNGSEIFYSNDGPDDIIVLTRTS